MTKTELESKHLAELHELAADAGVERYRMLPRAELIEKLAGGGGSAETETKGERKPRQRRERKPRQAREKQSEPGAEQKPQPTSSTAPETTKQATPPPPSSERPKRKRRRRWGRRRKGVHLADLLLPAAPGRQAIVYAEDRASCTALLRELAAELSAASNGGPDPIALLIDPSPEELADWKRDAPQAEIVAAGKANHADDALARAAGRAGSGEEVFVLIDSLSRYAEDFAGAEEARALLDAAANSGGGSLTVVAAVERPA